MTTAYSFPWRGSLGIGIMFASNGAIFASLLPWYPLFAADLGLRPVEFGFIVTAFAVGAIASSAAPAPLIAKYGPIRVTIIGTILLAAAVASAPWGTTGIVLAASLFLAGVFDAVVDVAQNVAGIRIEHTAGRSILSSMHALWSLGGVAGGVASTAAAAVGIDARVYLVAAALSAVALVSLGAVILGRGADQPVVAPDASRARAGRSRWRAVAIGAVPLVVVAMGGTMVEDVANNWAALAGTQLGSLDIETAGIAFTVMIASQCIGRFTGDALISRFGRAAIARMGGTAIAIGGIVVVSTPGSAAQVLIGLGLAGFGSATIVPSALAVASRLPGLQEGAGVTLVSWLMRLGFLATSPVIGALTEASSIRVGIALLIPIGVATFLCSGALTSGDSGTTRSK